MNHFTEALDLSRYTLYMQDYGGPVGFRMILAHPQRVKLSLRSRRRLARRGVGRELEDAASLWVHRATNESALRENLLSFATRTRHIGDDPNVERYDPDLWTDEFYLLNRPGRGRESRAICFLTIEPMWTPTRSGNRGCARSNRDC